MASIIVNRGLQVIGKRASVGTADLIIQVMSVDDGTRTIVAGDTTLSSDGTTGGVAPTNFLDKAFDATPTISGQTVSHVTTFATGEANFTIKRIALHNDTTTNVTGTSATLVCGIDSQTIAKTSSFSLKITIDLLYTSS